MTEDSGEYIVWETDDREMTAAEVAQVYGIKPVTVRAAIRRGQLPARKSGGTWLIKRSDAEARWKK